MFREIRRIKQKMTEEECLNVLQKQKLCNLAVFDENGYPYTFPMHYLYKDNAFWFHSARQGSKIDGIHLNNKASVSIISDGTTDDQEFTYHDSVIAFGRLTVLDEGEEHDRILLELCEKNFSPKKTITEMKGAKAVCVLKMDVEHMAGKHIRF